MPKLELQKNKPIILSVGGSFLVPEGGPNVEFLADLKTFVGGLVRSGHRVGLVTGGGRTARDYIDAAANVMKKGVDPEDLDWLGIHATRLNGHLVRTIFRDIAHPVVIKDPTKTPLRWRGRLLLAAGWKPGWSTDYVACRMAKRLGVTRVVNVTNVTHVYDEDPRKNPKANPLDELSWRAYRKMVGDKWHPGKSAPFDPVASRLCQRYKMEVAIVHGDDLKNVKKAVTGQNFVGTILK